MRYSKIHIVLFLKLLFMIVVLLFVYGFANQRHAVKKVVKIEVKFEDGKRMFLDSAMVNKMLIQNFDTLTNRAQSLINLHEVEVLISSNPYVKQAEVSIDLNGNFSVFLKHKNPVARVKIDQSAFYVNRHGDKMPLSEVYSSRVPLVSGLSSEKDLDSILFLINKMNEFNSLKYAVTDIYQNNGGGVEMYTREGHQIDFGNIFKTDDKLKKLVAFYDYYVDSKEKLSIKKIDLRYKNQVVCTKN